MHRLGGSIVRPFAEINELGYGNRRQDAEYGNDEYDLDQRVAFLAVGSFYHQANPFI